MQGQGSNRFDICRQSNYVYALSLETCRQALSIWYLSIFSQL